MKPQVKLGLYTAAALGTLIFGILFFSAWRQAAPDSKTRSADTTAAAEVTPEEEEVPDTNAAVAAPRGFSGVILWGLCAMASLVSLGALAAYDITQYASQRATDALYDDEGEEVTETTFEAVEKAHSAGEFLEAIRLLRQFLEEKPRAVQAQVRIAEIYEKDLNNPLAAALEYEEVLKQNFDPERKSWTAVHLVNLYNRLSKPDQAIELLQRVVTEFPDTPAAAKARERLEAAGVAPAEPPPAPDADRGGEPPPAASDLPPGFRRK